PELAEERKTGCKLLVFVSLGHVEHVAGLVGIRSAWDHHLYFPDCSAAINRETAGRPIVAVRSGPAPGLEQRRSKRHERRRQLRDRRDDFSSDPGRGQLRSEEHTSELQSRFDLVCRLLLEKKKNK